MTTLKSKVGVGVAALVIGASGLTLIQDSEGKVNRTYRDAVGIVTACYGHTGPELRMGMTFTDAQCDAMLDKDIRVHLVGIKQCIRVPLNQNQQDAVLSFAFNLGVGATCGSTLVRRLNAGDYLGAAHEFPKWNKAKVNGKLTVLKGLAIRRAREQALFLTPYTGEPVKVALRGILEPPKRSPFQWG